MKEMADIITNYGVTIVVIAYFMFTDYKFRQSLNTTLTTLQNLVESISDKLDKKEEN